ncbi:MAG: transposase, partial [Planctomycetes bacterium]|nr:transposase [Planctomycetota bacterium]
MATRIRITRVGATYHVTVRCNNKEHLIDPKTFEPMYLMVLKRAKDKYDVEVHNYTIMTNHVHLVLMTNLDNISRFMQYVNSQSARRY